MKEKEQEKAWGGLADWKRLQLSLLDNFARLLHLSQEWKLSERESQLRFAREELEEQPLRVIVFGQFKHGKSTFINALLQRSWPICPVGPIPLTARVCRIRQSSKPSDSFRVIYKDEQKGSFVQPLEEGSLRRYAGQSGEETGEVKHLEIYLRQEEQDSPLSYGVELLDTPGLGSVFEDHDEITRSHLQQADLVIFFFSALQPFTQEEKQFLQMHPELTSGPATLYVVNRIDQLGQMEGAPVQVVDSFVRSQLEDLDIKVHPSGVEEAPQLFPLSAFRAFRHAPWGEEPNEVLYAESRFEPLRQFMFKLLAEKKGALAAWRAMEKQTDALQRMRQFVAGVEGLVEKLQAKKLSLEELQERWRAVEKQQRQAQKKIVKLILTREKELKRSHELAVNVFTEDLKGYVPQWLQVSTQEEYAPYVSKLLSSFCQSWMKGQSRELEKNIKLLLQDAAYKMEEFEHTKGVEAHEEALLQRLMTDQPESNDDSGLMTFAGLAAAAAAGATAWRLLPLGSAFMGGLGGPLGVVVAAGVGALLAAMFQADWREEATEQLKQHIEQKMGVTLRDTGHEMIESMCGALMQSVKGRFDTTLEEVQQQLYEAECEMQQTQAQLELTEEDRQQKKQQLLDVERALDHIGAELKALFPVANLNRLADA